MSIADAIRDRGTSSLGNEPGEATVNYCVNGEWHRSQIRRFRTSAIASMVLTLVCDDDAIENGLRAVGRSLETDVLSPEAAADFNRVVASDLAHPTLEPQILPEWHG